MLSLRLELLEEVLYVLLDLVDCGAVLIVYFELQVAKLSIKQRSVTLPIPQRHLCVVEILLHSFLKLIKGFFVLWHCGASVVDYFLDLARLEV